MSPEEAPTREEYGARLIGVMGGLEKTTPPSRERAKTKKAALSRPYEEGALSLIHI